MLQKRVVITGMAINTPIGDTLDEFINNLMDGKSAVTKWDTLDTSRIYAKVGGDLGKYDVHAKILSYKDRIPEDIYNRLLKLGSKSPLSIAISLLISVEAFLDSGYIKSIEDGNNIATIIAGHNLNQKYTFENHDVFNEEPEFVEGLFALNGRERSD